MNSINQRREDEQRLQALTERSGNLGVSTLLEASSSIKPGATSDVTELTDKTLQHCIGVLETVEAIDNGEIETIVVPPASEE